MQPQSSGSLRSNAGAEKGKEIAAKLNIHRIHGQLRGLDTTGKPFQIVEVSVFIEASGYSWPWSSSLVVVFFINTDKKTLEPGDFADTLKRSLG